MLRAAVFTVLALAALWGAASCQTYHSSSIAGHDSTDIAILPDIERRRLAVGFEAKTSPTTAMFTKDRTNSVMGTAFVRAQLLEFQEKTLYLRAALSEYVAANTLEGKDYSGYGTVASLRPSFVVDDASNRYEFAYHAVFNQEYGAYRQFRQSMTDDNSWGGPRFDLSPNGQAATSLWEGAVTMKDDPRVTLVFGYGYTYMDFLRSDEYEVILKLCLIVPIDRGWVSLGLHSMSLLNAGFSLGFGAQVY